MVETPTVLDSSDPSGIATAAQALCDGRLVAFPTETVYGLGADATNAEAVARVFHAKQRPAFDPLIVHIADKAAVDAVVTSVPVPAARLMDAFWPGPLTLVLPKRAVIPDLVTAGLPGVGIRIPQHPVALELLRSVRFPVAAPSANPFGGISPTTARHVAEGLGANVDCILDGGPCAVGLESTVISFMTGMPVLLRPGGCPIEEIESLVGPVTRVVCNPDEDDSAQPAPGMLSRHYAPSTKLTLVARDKTAIAAAKQRSGLLTYGSQPCKGHFERIEWLGPTDDLRTCAAAFFAALRSLDSCALDVIIAHEFPDQGLGLALNDRLRRAACR